MSNPRYLFDEEMSPEGMVSVSQIQSFMSCRKKWEYGYIEEITPRVDRSYLTIGKLCHKGMQMAMRAKMEYNDWRWHRKRGMDAIEEEWQEYMNTTDLLDEEIPGMQQMLADAKSVFYQAFEEFQPWRYDVLTFKDRGATIPALELHFKVPCRPTKGLHGYIDAILRDRETGFVWCVDYKFRKTLAPDDDEANNIQNAVYAYACQKLGISITGTMTWQHLNTPAADPQILKNGTVSRAKIKTTWDHYRDFLLENDQDPKDYEDEMILKLADIEWCRATLEYRNTDTINKIWRQCIVPVAKEINKSRKSEANYRSLYPWNCKMCQYQSLCQAELRGYDADYIRLHDYTKRTHARSDNKSIDESVATVV